MTGLNVFVAGVAVAVLASAQATPPPDPLVKAGATQKLADHTYAIPDGNVPLVPNVGIVVGSRAVLVIDPGLGRRNGETVAAEVAKVAPRHDVFVTATHFHAEHTTGHLAFPPPAKYIASSIQDAEFAEGGPQQIALFASRSPLTAQLLAGATGRRPDISFDRAYTLDLGDVLVRMSVVGPTHTLGDTLLLVEPDNVLFAGDVIMNQSFLAATPASSVRAWLAAFDLAEATEPRIIVPSHGPIGDGSLIATNRTALRAIQSRTQTLKAEGRSVDDAVTAVQAEMQREHPGWARTNGIAAAVRAAYTEAR